MSFGNVGHSRRSTAGVPQRPAIPSSAPLVTDHDAKARPGRRPPTQWNNRCIIPRLYQATFASSPLFPDIDSTPNPKIYRSAAMARSRSRCRGAAPPRCKVGSVGWNVEKRGGGATRDADRWPPHDPPHSKLTAVSRAGLPGSGKVTSSHCHGEFVELCTGDHQNEKVAPGPITTEILNIQGENNTPIPLLVAPPPNVLSSSTSN